MLRCLFALAAALIATTATSAGLAQSYFRTSDLCLACHNGLTASSGEDVSIGFEWRASMMASSARDPYWQGAVRREVLDHPEHQAEIEDECSICHMPITTFESRAAGGKGIIFAHLAFPAPAPATAAQAADGVSCSVCHQNSSERLGSPRSFTGGFRVDRPEASGQRRAFGPYLVKGGLDRIMRSSTDLQPSQSSHLQRSELCATCHTLYTRPIGHGGEELAPFPEQVPYLEWRRSAYREVKSCQTCHMPVLDSPTPISNVLGEPRPGFSRHLFQGGNFLMPRMLNRYRAEQRVSAEPQELDAASRRAIEHLRSSAARLQIAAAALKESSLELEVVVRNLAGHKLPTAYPSRRVWLRLLVRNGAGQVLFESGGLTAMGAIRGNANDEYVRHYEPHHRLIERPDQVQIYESIMVDSRQRVTTGLLAGARYIKDNRLLPEGFAKAGAPSDIAVRGDAASDPDFQAGGDRVRYRIPLRSPRGTYTVEAELWYQPIGFRWAENLRSYRAPETTRFATYFRSMAGSSALRLLHTSTRVTTPP